MCFPEAGVRVLSYLKRPILPVLFFFALYTPAFAETESICYGTTAKGKLENGWQLPSSGANYEAYSLIGVAAGRNYVHSSVYHAVEYAYRLLESTQPNKHFVYGETGWASGGPFKPHKTHQNGLSVDFFVPVINNKGQSVTLPTHVFNKLGYNIEFSSTGKYEDYSIDFDAMASHLLAIKIIADKQGVKIWRVIFDNELQRLLFKTSKGAELKSALPFSTKKPWVRHDEHYHVDFIIPCR
jgi:penicillin-insensitive murein endopeptidase